LKLLKQQFKAETYLKSKVNLLLMHWELIWTIDE